MALEQSSKCLRACVRVVRLPCGRLLHAGVSRTMTHPLLYFTLFCIHGYGVIIERAAVVLEKVSAILVPKAASRRSD